MCKTDGGDFMAKPFGVRPASATSRCSDCSGAATVEALFSIGGTIVSRDYCDTCLENAEYNLTEILKIVR